MDEIKSFTLKKKIRNLYDKFGQRKEMGKSSGDYSKPHYFLLRTFIGENDLLIIFNTKRCRYQCSFCRLPDKSSDKFISENHILQQFEYVMKKTKHALSILDRVTLSNEGSILDDSTFPRIALFNIVEGINELRRVRTLVLETRIEFIEPEYIEEIYKRSSRITINILTGFETLDPFIRDNILFKRQSLSCFEDGLDRICKLRCGLTCYILYKPGQTMTDKEAYKEAEISIDYLNRECLKRNIPLTIRINPMYLALGSKWADIALITKAYNPPKLGDILNLAKKKKEEGIEIYIGLSTEGLSGQTGTYLSREDYSTELLKRVILFNTRKYGNYKS